MGSKSTMDTKTIQMAIYVWFYDYYYFAVYVQFLTNFERKEIMIWWFVDYDYELINLESNLGA